MQARANNMFSQVTLALRFSPDSYQLHNTYMDINSQVR